VFHPSALQTKQNIIHHFVNTPLHIKYPATFQACNVLFYRYYSGPGILPLKIYLKTAMHTLSFNPHGTAVAE